MQVSARRKTDDAWGVNAARNECPCSSIKYDVIAQSSLLMVRYFQFFIGQ